MSSVTLTSKSKQQQQIKIKKEMISFDDVKALIKDMGINKYDEDSLKLLFVSFDKEKKGSILKSDFLEHLNITKTDIITKSDEYLTKLEVAVRKLHSLKIKFEEQKDLDGASDCAWIIETLLSSNLNELVMEKKDESIEQDALKQYSNAQEVLNIRKDMNNLTSKGYKANMSSMSMTTKQLKDNVSEISKTSKYQNHLNLNLNNPTHLDEVQSKKSYDPKNTKRKSIVSNISHSSIKEHEEQYYSQSNFYKESMKVNLGERRSTINSVTPQLANELNSILSKLEDFEFNIFELDKLAGVNTMLYVANEIFSNLYFYEDMIDEMVFKRFVVAIASGYSRNVLYHNDIHATDVLQTVYVMMEKGSVYYKCSLMEIDYIAILVAAMCHDFRHPGIGNSYLINSKHKIAMTFNGKVLN